MSETHGLWMRSQRQARGWNVPQMGRKLREAAASAGDMLPSKDCLMVMIHRWEDDRSGISERYRLHYCKAFQIPADEFGHPAAEPERSGDRVGLPDAVPAVAAVAPGSRHPVPDFWQSAGGQLAGAARESGEHAQGAELRSTGLATLERCRVTVIRLSRESLSGEPLAVFARMRNARDQLHAAAGERSWPADRHEIYVALGCLNSLMAAAAQHAGSPDAAGELALAGLAYATVTSCRPLTARLRLDLAITAYWSGWYADCLDQARTGLEHAPGGPAAAQLHLIRARAAARLGDASTARDAITAAGQAGDAAGPPGLAATVNQIRFSPAACHYHTGTALAQIPGAAPDAVAELERAISLYTAASEPGASGDHDYMTARADLALARLRDGELEAAQLAAGPVMALPRSRRVSGLVPILAQARAELDSPRYGGSAQARHFSTQIEQFCAHAITTQAGHAPPASGSIGGQPAD